MAHGAIVRQVQLRRESVVEVRTTHTQRGSLEAHGSCIDRSVEVDMSRKIADCRQMPSESNCSLTISGEEDEVVRAAAEHAVSVHGHSMSDKLRSEIRSSLKDEAGYKPPKSP
jgi:hypothetical protein